jgi:hypothetical protein
MCMQELTWTTPLVPSMFVVLIADDPVPLVCNLVPSATYVNVLAAFVAMVVMVCLSLSAEATTVPFTTWYLSRLARTACREIDSCLVLNC